MWNSSGGASALEGEVPSGAVEMRSAAGAGEDVFTTLGDRRSGRNRGSDGRHSAAGRWALRLSKSRNNIGGSFGAVESLFRRENGHSWGTLDREGGAFKPVLAR